MQLSFSRLWDGYATDKDALKARGNRVKELKQKGYRVKCFTLHNQMKKYDGLGEYNGGCCNVYMINFEERQE